jgi:hypothetical protein
MARRALLGRCTRPWLSKKAGHGLLAEAAEPLSLRACLQWWGALIINRNFQQTDQFGRPVYILK